nr:hypothetical protein [Tanacetum cinerariifolium]
MVAILEKTEHNTDFHQIVNFLEASHIRYALTVRPTVNVSHIRLFWSTTRVKTTNGETKIIAKVNGRQSTVFESSIRRHLKLNDEEGPIFTSVEVSHSYHYAVLSPKSTSYNEFSSNIATALVCLATNRTYNFFKMIFDGMMRNVKIPHGEGSEHPFEPHHTPSNQDEPIHHKQITQSPQHEQTTSQEPTIPSQSHSIISTPRRITRGTIRISQSQVPSPGADETVFPTGYVRYGEAFLTVTRLDARQNMENIAKTSAISHEASPKPSKKKILEQMSVQLARDLEAKFAQEDQIIRVQSERDSKIARIHAKRELEMIIAELDRRNKMVAKYLIWEKMQDFVPMNSKLESERLKRPGIQLGKESFKKLKTAEASSTEPTQEQQSEEPKELYEEELKKMELVPVEELYIEALQFGQGACSTIDVTDEKEKELWVELKRLYEPDSKDPLWALQRYMHDPLVWRLYDTCGVHYVSTGMGHEIFMLVEKDYPLTKGLITLMLCNKLQVD